MKKDNEVEVLLQIFEHMIDTKLEKNPESGVKLENGNKMKYIRMKKVLKNLKSFMLLHGSIEFYDICKNCDYYTEPKAGWGKCTNSDRIKLEKPAVHSYFTCWRNTSSRFDKKKGKFEK